MTPVLKTTDRGLYCSAGNFYVDPWLPVERAVLTHAHGDHARAGSAQYYCSRSSELIVRKRLGAESRIHPTEEKTPFTLGKASVSFHPAGHILGSSQVRIEVGREVWVMSGDYKRAPDPTCTPFEPVPCDTFITEATFGYPIYQWDPSGQVAQEIFDWWEENRKHGTTSILFCYALGKAQRLLAELRRFTDRTILTHGAIETLNECYRSQGISIGATCPVSETDPKSEYAGELVLAPPSASGSAWLRRFRKVDTAFASGWMRVRGNRRRRGYDRGFTFSDHADWPALLQTIEQTRAKTVLVTHGSSDVLIRYLKERGQDSRPLETAFEGTGES